MKKTLLFAIAALMAMPMVAQEEDVTYLIQNAGFDEDLTFQADGTMKEAVSTSTSLSDRSWAYIAADSTVYARPKETSSQNRPDGRKLEAVNGFKGRVQGWTLESNAEFPKCEWTYFGTVAYDLASGAVPIADDGSTYLEVPARPTEFDGGTGFVYLRAGWTNSANYKQVVKLPCAKYRLEYWTININPNTSSVAKDLTQIVCRKEVFKDESGEGLQAQEWTKHEFEFTPTAEFTMQFGYEAANAGSGGQPIVGLDGIKLYKIDDAYPEEILMADINDMLTEMEGLKSEAEAVGYTGLIADIEETYTDLLEASWDAISVEEMEVLSKQCEEAIAKMKEALAAIPAYESALAKVVNALTNTNYPGKDALNAFYETLLGYQTTGTMDQLIGAEAEANEALRTYYMSQEASEASPADYTFFVQSPWFIKPEAEPTLQDGYWVFPNADNYVVGGGQGTNADLDQTGWYISGATGGDQRLNWQQGRSCWNCWNSGFTTTIAVAQDLTGLPNGYYTVSADLITQAGYANNTQHVFAKSPVQKTISNYLSADGWVDDGAGEWETLTTNGKVLVIDGKLTIGAEGTGDGNASAGWFLATNFKLYYLGEAGADALQTAFYQRVDEANLYASTMHLAADREALQAVIGSNSSASDAESIIAALDAINAAMTTAEASEAKYADYMAEVEGKTLFTVKNALAANEYGDAQPIIQFAYDWVMQWIGGPTATYTEFDNTVNQLKNYLNTYLPAWQAAAEVYASASGTGRDYLGGLMESQKAQLVSEMQSAEVVNAFVAELQVAATNVEKQVIWETEGATDYTAFIINPMLASENGWTFDKGNGNNNTGGGQWFDGDGSVRYIDSYNANGLEGYIATQLVTGLPNGTYELGVYTRAPAEGAYVFYAAGEEEQKQFTEIPLDYYTDAEGMEQIASDTHGPIWAEAEAAFNNGSEDATVLAIYNANNGNGRGWKHQVIESITVQNHQLLIGTATGSEALGTEKVFAGAWYSAGGWTLTLTSKGDNSGWEGPLAQGIERIVAGQQAADGIYTISGVKTAKMQRGLNIVISNGKAHKVLVK